MFFLKEDTAADIKLGPFVDKTDGVTYETGLAAAMDHANTGVRLSKNGGAFADRHEGTEPAYDAFGYYLVKLDTTDTNTPGTLKVIFGAAATCLPCEANFQIVSANVYDSLFAAATTDYLDVQVKAIDANAITATAINADAITNAKIADDAIAVENIKDAAITAAKIAADAIELAKIKDGAISAAKFAANAITSTVIADDAITAAKLNTGAITADAFAADAIVAATLNTGCLTSDAFAANAITNAAVADDVDVNVKTITAGAITAAAIATDAIDDDAVAANVTAVIAAAVWNAETASYGGAGTYGQAVEDVLTDTGTTLDTLIKDIPTVAEFEARTIAAADYTVVGDLGVVQTGDSFAIVNGDHGLVSIQDDIDAILLDTGTDGVKVASIAANAIDAAAIKADAIDADAFANDAIDEFWDRASTLTLSFETLVTRIYQILNNAMTIDETTGAVSLKALGPGAEIAAGDVDSAAGVTDRDELTWS